MERKNWLLVHCAWVGGGNSKRFRLPSAPSLFLWLFLISVPLFLLHQLPSWSPFFFFSPVHVYIFVTLFLFCFILYFSYSVNSLLPFLNFFFTFYHFSFSSLLVISNSSSCSYRSSSFFLFYFFSPFISSLLSICF